MRSPIRQFLALPSRDEWSPKYRKGDSGANWDINDVDTPLYRYAEAILIYAEAQSELGNELSPYSVFIPVTSECPTSKISR